MLNVRRMGRGGKKMGESADLHNIVNASIVFGQFPIFLKVQIADFTVDSATCLVDLPDVFLAKMESVKLCVTKIACVAVLRHLM